jgi:hypothetical protein
MDFPAGISRFEELACPQPVEFWVNMPGALPELTVTGNGALLPSAVRTTTFALADP